MAQAPELIGLRSRLTGRLVLPGDNDYNDAKRAWNLGVEQHPAAVAVPAGVSDVQQIVRAAAEAGLGVLTQPNGHSAGADLSDIVLVRPRVFDEVSIDVARRTARVGAGVNWGRVLTALDGSGLVALAGSNPEVNTVAYSLAGGHSLFARTYGLQSPAVTAVELVDASGEFTRVTQDADPDLMWALRGAGGLFGVVTAIEFSLFDGDELFGGKLMFTPESAAELLAAMFEVARSEPTLGLSFGMMNFPGAPSVPELLRGKTVASVDILHIGGFDTGAPAIAPLRSVGTPFADTTQVFGIGSLAQVAAEPTDPMPYADWSSASSGYDSTSAEGLIDAFAKGSSAGLTRIEVRPFGGALLAGSREHAVAGRIDAAAYVGASVIAPSPEALTGVDEAFAPLTSAAASTPATGNVPTFLDERATLGDAFDGAAIARLKELKAERDPSGVIRGARRLPD
ncbi:FAD-binding oxidoreductase [Humibacter soli]